MSTQVIDPALEALRYPIGRFKRPENIGPAERESAIKTLAALPVKLSETLHGWSDSQLDTPYREGGWTVRALTHHIADSHMTAFARMRFALTEDAPTIKVYEEDAWSKLPDSQSAPIAWSLQMIDGVHARWVFMLRALNDEQWSRTFVHPERPHPISVETALTIYAWHSVHHVAHITRLHERMGW